jgi:hypothetical protein
VGTIHAAAAAHKNAPKAEVIMLRLLKSFDRLSLKVVAVPTADDSEFGFEFSTPRPPSTPSALTTSVEQPAERRHDQLPGISTWPHGGLNE